MCSNNINLLDLFKDYQKILCKKYYYVIKFISYTLLKIMLLERNNEFSRLTNKYIRKIIEPVADSKVTHQKLIHSGLSNTNYLIHLDNGLNLILRIHKDVQAGIKEYNINKNLSGIPYIPKVIHFSPNSKNQQAYSIIEYCDGQPMMNLKIKDDVMLYSQLAHVLAEISQFKYMQCGMLDSNLTVKPIETKTSGHHPFVNYMLDCLNDGNLKSRLSSTMRKAVLQFVYNNENLLDCLANEPFQLVHGDFKKENILVNKRENGGHRLVAIIDWEYARADLLYSDIATLFRGQYLKPSSELYIAFERALVDKNINLANNWFKISKYIDLINLLSFLCSSKNRPNFYHSILIFITHTMHYFDYEC